MEKLESLNNHSIANHQSLPQTTDDIGKSIRYELDTYEYIE